MRDIKIKTPKSRGSIILVVVAGIIILSALGAAISMMTSSSMQTNIVNNYQQQSYYAALSGINYAKSLTATELENIRTGAASATYTFGSNSFTLTVSTKNASGTYPVASLGSAYGGKGNHYIGAVNVTPVTAPSQGSGLSKKLMAAKSSIFFGGDINGDIASGKIEMNEGSNVRGSLVSTSSSVALTVTKNVVGTISDPITICSNSDVVIASSGNILYGNVYAHGKVSIGRPIVGNVYATGDVSFNSNASVTGDVYTQGKLNITSGHIYGTAHVTSLSLVTKPELATRVVQETVSNPISCGEDYSFPGHETPSTNTVFSTTSDYIFVGKGINDHTYSYKSFTAGWGSRLCFDVSSGYVNIFVANDTMLRAEIHIKALPTQTCFTNDYTVSGIGLSYKSYASKIYMDTTGAVTLDGGRNWFGTIYSGGNVILGSGNYITGALYSSGGYIGGSRLDSKPDIHMDYVESEYFESR